MFGAAWDLGKTIVQGYVQGIKANQAVNQAVIERRLSRAQNKDLYDHEWEMAQLASACKFERVIVLIIVILPVIITSICPSCGLHIFAALDMLPEWYRNTFGTIVLSIFGIHYLKNPLSSLFATVKSKSITK
jgi:hypothetical protein